MLRTILFFLISLVAAVAVSVRSPFTLRSEQWDAFVLVTPLVALLILLAFVVGEITQNYSQVDKLWSVVPAVYAWIFCACSDWQPRMILVSSLVLLWGARLSGNFARRGGYQWPPWRGEEDYRWEVLRQSPLFAGHRLRFSAFNLLFVCGYQMTLVYLFTLPVLLAWTDRPLSPADGVLAVLTLTLLTVEFVADQQQYDFQTEKHRQIAQNGVAQGSYALGFVHTGLWRYCRHPNYIAEQAIWICIYGFSVVATGQWINPTIIGPLLLSLLFVGSSDFSEGISAGKYPQYAQYAALTPRFLPRPWGERFSPLPPGPESDEKNEAG